MYKTDEKCLVCHGSTGVKITLFCCGAIIHPNCLTAYKSNTCPTCRQSLCNIKTPEQLLALSFCSYTSSLTPLRQRFQKILFWIQTNGLDKTLEKCARLITNQSTFEQAFPDFPIPTLLRDNTTTRIPLSTSFSRIQEHIRALTVANRQPITPTAPLVSAADIKEALEFCRRMPCTVAHLAQLKQLFPEDDDAATPIEASRLNAGIGSFAMESIGIDLSVDEHQHLFAWFYVFSLIVYFCLYLFVPPSNITITNGAAGVLFRKFSITDADGDLAQLKVAISHHCGSSDDASSILVVDDHCVHTLIAEARETFLSLYPTDLNSHLQFAKVFWLAVYMLELLIRCTVTTTRPSIANRMMMPIGMLIAWYTALLTQE